MNKKFREVCVGQRFKFPSKPGEIFTRVEETSEGFSIGNARDSKGELVYVEDRDMVGVVA